MLQIPFTALTQAVMPRAFQTGLFDSTCTIQQPSGAIGPGGAPLGTYSNVIGIVGIACMDAPPSQARIQATQNRALPEISSKQLRHVLLDGYFPTIGSGVAAGWRAVVTNNKTTTAVTYNILGAESDSQNTQTRLELQLVGV